MTVKHHSFGKGRYRVVTDEIIDGYAEVPRKSKTRDIYISAALPPRRALWVLVHEAIHAEFPDWSESRVQRLSDALTGILWRVGYRRSGDGG